MGYEMVDKLVPMEDIFLESMYENEIRKTKDILELAAGNLNSDDRRLYKMMYSVGENVVHINENNKKKLENYWMSNKAMAKLNLKKKKKVENYWMSKKTMGKIKLKKKKNVNY